MIASPDQDAFVLEHEGLVYELARMIDRQLRVDGIFDDLVAHGFVGLLEARDRFEPERGIEFAAFAHHRVRGAIWDGVRKMQHVPTHAHRYARTEAAAVAASTEALDERSARGPETELDAIGAALDSLAGRITGAVLLADLASAPRTPEADLIREVETDRVRRALGTLPEREQIVLRGMYFEDRPLDDIGAEVGLSRSGASRAHTRALGMLRDCLG